MKYIKYYLLRIRRIIMWPYWLGLRFLRSVMQPYLLGLRKRQFDLRLLDEVPCRTPNVSWNRITPFFSSHHLQLEEIASGHIFLFKKVHSPFTIPSDLPEGNYGVRIVARFFGIPFNSNMIAIKNTAQDYLNMKGDSARPDAVRSPQDEGSKFQPSRGLKITNIQPGQVLPLHPQVRWLTTIPDVLAFDVVFFNKKKLYWVYLRNIENNNVVPYYGLEPGDYYVLIKATRNLGQIWSYPLSVSVEEGALQAVTKIEDVVKAQYQDLHGNSISTPQIPHAPHPVNRVKKEEENWHFRVDFEDSGIIGTQPTISWTPVENAVRYNVNVRPLSAGLFRKNFPCDNQTTLTLPELLSEGQHRFSVQAFVSQKNGVERIYRTAAREVEVVAQPEQRRAVRHESENKIRNKIDAEFQDHLDLIQGMDFYTNHALKRWEIENGVTQLLSFPTKLTALVGYNCNIDCVFCDNGRVPRNITIPEEYMRDFQHFMPYSQVLQILGGEPLMLKEFKQLVDMAADYPHLQLITTTNGTLVDDEWAYYFSRANFANIWMSVDGATEEAYQTMRRGGELHKVVEGVKKIVDYGDQAPSVCWSFIIAKPNYKEIVDYYKLARDLGVKSIYYKMLQTRSGPNYPGVNEIDILMDREACKQVVRDLAEVYQLAKRDGVGFDERVFGYFEPIYPDLVQSYRDMRSDVSLICEEEIEGGDDMGKVTGYKKLPEPQRGNPEEQNQILNRLIQHHIQMGHNRHAGISLSNTPQKMLCALPFTHLGLNGTNAYMCCYGSDQVLPINFQNDWHRLMNVWNSPRYQFSREKMFTQEIDQACLRTCPLRKQPDSLWYVSQLLVQSEAQGSPS